MNDTDKRAIEEMAHDLCGRCQDGICVVDGKPCNLDLDCTCQINATTLYNAGYRKQRTAEWVTTTETEDGLIVRYTHRCTDCNYFYKTVCPRGDDYCHKCGAKMKGGE